MSVWDELVSQEATIALLADAVEAAHGRGENQHSMTHAWLITGPPGSGRSNAARAFAAALLCPNGGCGECQSCRTVANGSHPDVTVLNTQQLSIGVEQVRDIALRAGMSPTLGAYQIIIVEDADRVTDRGADALLKSLEEPPPRTVWMLCAPTPDDVIVTIRSRCRQVHLRTPSNSDVTNLLISRDGIDPETAGHAARAAQGHIGRARGLARNEKSRESRRRWLQVPAHLKGVSDCLQIAQSLVDEATKNASEATVKLDEAETAELRQALGFGTKGTRPKNAQAALKDLEKQQKMRAKRFQRDSLDRVLTELSTWYRDVLSMQIGAVDIDESTDGLINSSIADQIRAAADATNPSSTIKAMSAIIETRQALDFNVAPLLAFESLMLKLYEG